MSYRYWTVGQAILNPGWIEDNGKNWRCIRIEITRIPEHFAETEHTVIFKPFYSDFEEWVDDHDFTDKPLSVDELVKEYREETGEFIEIWQPPH